MLVSQLTSKPTCLSIPCIVCVAVGVSEAFLYGTTSSLLGPKRRMSASLGRYEDADSFNDYANPLQEDNLFSSDADLGMFKMPLTLLIYYVIA